MKESNITTIAEEELKPYVNVLSMNSYGQLVVEFTAPIFELPDLEMIRHGNFSNDEGIILPIFTLKLIPQGEVSEARNLEFDWFVESMTDRLLTLQIVFKKAHYISIAENNDKLRVIFNDKWTFVSKDFVFLQEGTFKQQAKFDKRRLWLSEESDAYIEVEINLPR